MFHSPFEYGYLLLPLIGFVVGLFGSLIGGGGGFFFLPVLTLLFNVPAQVAVATSLAATLPICIVGSVGHYQNKNLDLRLGFIFSLAGIAGAVAGTFLTRIMTPSQLKMSFGIYSILIAFQIIYSNWRKKRAETSGIALPANTPLGKISKGTFFGFLAGTITGTFGTSGATPVQAGLFALDMPIKLVVGTTLMVVAVNTFSAMTTHFVVGEIDLTLVWFLTAGTVIGSFAGTKLLAGVKMDRAETPIRKWYAVGLIAFGILMIFSS